MSAETLLSRLDKVRKTEAGRWIAKCPAHGDRTPSLSIRELGDGRVLVHCFSGCSAPDVMAAVGLEMGDLFPEPIGDRKPERRAFSATDALRCLEIEGLVIRRPLFIPNLLIYIVFSAFQGTISPGLISRIV
jgi:hypothetical protein